MVPSSLLILSHWLIYHSVLRLVNLTIKSGIILRIILIIRVPNKDDGLEDPNALLLATMVHILSLLIIRFFYMVLHLKMRLADFQIDTQICYQ